MIQIYKTNDPNFKSTKIYYLIYKESDTLHYFGIVNRFGLQKVRGIFLDPNVALLHCKSNLQALRWSSSLALTGHNLKEQNKIRSIKQIKYPTVSHVINNGEGYGYNKVYKVVHYPEGITIRNQTITCISIWTQSATVETSTFKGAILVYDY
jgi:hypothetical protein